MKLYNAIYEAPRVIFVESVADRCFCGSTVDGQTNERFEQGDPYIIF